MSDTSPAIPAPSGSAPPPANVRVTNRSGDATEAEQPSREALAVRQVNRASTSPAPRPSESDGAEPAVQSDGPRPAGKPARRAHFLEALLGPRHQMVVALVAGVALGLGYLLRFAAADEGAAAVAAIVLFWISLALGSLYGVPAALKSLRQLRPNIDVLMVVGAYLSAAIGHPDEGGLLLLMFTLAGALERRAMAKARDAVTRLHRLMPKEALRKEGDEWVAVGAEALRAGDLVLVRPGETVPADGVVIDGRSHVDQSRLTGESLPRVVTPDETVFAGTINQDSALEVRVTRPVAESSIQKILRLVLEAQERRQPIQRLLDQFATPYSIAVMVLAALSVPAFALMGDRTWIGAIYGGITLLVVASPCALIIATPTATLCGLSRAARAGVLIKGGDAMERLSRVGMMAVDKTGTLTTGQIEVTRVEPVGAADLQSLLRVAMAAEQRSTHPIAAAIVRLARSRDLRPVELASLSNVAGRGIEGVFEGKPVRIGNFEFCEPIIDVCFRAHTKRLVEGILEEGGKPVVVAWRGEAVVLGLADTPRAGAELLADQLRDVGVDRIAMLTGDHQVIAERVAAQLGITEVHAELMPEDKVEHLRRMRGEPDGADSGGARGGLAVVGDGVNDAPALAVADVGLAMGAIGADAALETADVVLLRDDLSRIPWTIGLARRVRRIMMANLIFAMSVIAVLVAFTVADAMPLTLGVVGHEGSTLLVVCNSLRLLLHPDR